MKTTFRIFLLFYIAKTRINVIIQKTIMKGHELDFNISYVAFTITTEFIFISTQ